MRLWYLSHRQPATAQASLRSPEPSLFAHMKYGSRRKPAKSQTSSLTGWLRMRVWRMSLRRTKSTIISWDGLFIVAIHFPIIVGANLQCDPDNPSECEMTFPNSGKFESEDWLWAASWQNQQNGMCAQSDMAKKMCFRFQAEKTRYGRSE